MERGEVLLDRRDGLDLVLVLADQMAAVADAFRAVAANEPVSGLPWLHYLGPEGAGECVRELKEVGQAAVATGELGLLRSVRHQWYATTLARWDEGQSPGDRAERPRELPRPA